MSLPFMRALDVEVFPECAAQARGRGGLVEDAGRCVEGSSTRRKPVVSARGTGRLRPRMRGKAPRRCQEHGRRCRLDGADVVDALDLASSPRLRSPGTGQSRHSDGRRLVNSRDCEQNLAAASFPSLRLAWPTSRDRSHGPIPLPRLPRHLGREGRRLRSGWGGTREQETRRVADGALPLRRGGWIGYTPARGLVPAVAASIWQRAFPLPTPPPPLIRCPSPLPGEDERPGHAV